MSDAHLRNLIATAVLHDGDGAVKAYLKSLGDSEFHALMALLRRTLESPDACTRGAVVDAFSRRFGYVLSAMEADREARAAMV